MSVPFRRPPARPRPPTHSFDQLSGPEKLQRLLHSFPIEAAAVVALIDFVWQRKIEDLKRPH